MKVKIGKGKKVDRTAVLGYATARKIASHDLVIGRGATIRSGTVIYGGTTIGDDLQTGHNVVIREENALGDRVWIWSNSVIDYGCRIGSRVRIHCGCYVAQKTVIEDDAFLAPGVVVANDKYPLSDQLEGPTIRKGARVGCNVTLLPGVVIGAGALIGAGSVVTKDVPDGAVAYGNPARVVKR